MISEYTDKFETNELNTMNKIIDFSTKFYNTLDFAHNC